MASIAQSPLWQPCRQERAPARRLNLEDLIRTSCFARVLLLVDATSALVSGWNDVHRRARCLGTVHFMRGTAAQQRRDVDLLQPTRAE